MAFGKRVEGTQAVLGSPRISNLYNDTPETRPQDKGPPQPCLAPPAAAFSWTGPDSLTLTFGWAACFPLWPFSYWDNSFLGWPSWAVFQGSRGRSSRVLNHTASLLAHSVGQSKAASFPIQQVVRWAASCLERGWQVVGRCWDRHMWPRFSSVMSRRR